MGIYGTWLSATPDEAKALFRIEENAPAFNPFTREKTIHRALRIDTDAIVRIQSVSEKWLTDESIAALVDASPKEDFIRVYPEILEPDLCRVSPRVTRALAELSGDSDAIVRAAIARLEARGSRSFRLDVEICDALRAMARDAIARDANIWGFHG